VGPKQPFGEETRISIRYLSIFDSKQLLFATTLNFAPGHIMTHVNKPTIKQNK